MLVGSIPFPDKEAQERIKLQILDYLYKTFGLVEEDFISAEIELVPAGKARDIGWDQSLIGAYGQDDRICAYSSLRAIGEISRKDEGYFSNRDDEITEMGRIVLFHHD